MKFPVNDNVIKIQNKSKQNYPSNDNVIKVQIKVNKITSLQIVQNRQQ